MCMICQQSRCPSACPGYDPRKGRERQKEAEQWLTGFFQIPLGVDFEGEKKEQRRVNGERTDDGLRKDTKEIRMKQTHGPREREEEDGQSIGL